MCCSCVVIRGRKFFSCGIAEVLWLRYRGPGDSDPGPYSCSKCFLLVFWGYRQKCVSGPGVSGGVRVLSILVECRCLLRLRRRDHRAPGRWVLRKLVWFARQGRSAVAR